MAIQSPLLLVIFTTFIGLVDADYDKFHFTDCGSRGVDIQDIDLPPMPIYHPSTILLTAVAYLKRPISK